MTQEPALDWHDWHGRYDLPGSRLAGRLVVVQQELRNALDERPGPIRIVSMCAGQGRDVIAVLADHPRRDEVAAHLVEIDPRNAEIAESAIRRAGLDRMKIVLGDAALTDSYAGAVPADIVLECGVFGNITNDDVKRTVEFTPRLCAAGATVIWTRGKDETDVAGAIRGWYIDAGFEEVAFHAPDDAGYRVGVHRLITKPQPFKPGVRLFTFFR